VQLTSEHPTLGTTRRLGLTLLTRIESRKVAAWIAVSGALAVLVMGWLVNHPTSWTFTSHYDYGFTDLYGRLSNLQNLQHTGNIYVPFADQAFTYPPGAIFFFWPITWIPVAQLTFLWSVVSLAALAGALVVVLNHLFRRGLLLTIGVSCWAATIAAAVVPPVTECLTWGQVGTIILLLVVLDLFVLRGPMKGVGVGLATAIKVYPGLFIVVWLVRRQWRPAITAIITTSITTSLAWLLWPRSAWTFLTQVFLGGQEFNKLTGGVNPLKSSSVVAMFMRPPFHEGFLDRWENVALVLLVAAIALAGAERLWRLGFELSAMVVILIASVICAPVTWDHYFAFAPLLVLMPFELGVRSPLARTAVVAGVIMLVPWFVFRQPLEQTAWTAVYSFVARNALLFSVLAVLAASFWERSPDKVHLRRAG
jgi:alpha-1,2-mannosyltransferase